MIKNPNDIVDALVNDFLSVLQTELQSVFMYGSAVSHEFRPGVSDINTALVLTDNSILRLHELADIHKSWLRKGVATPLFMTKEYIDTSLDSYPIEFLDMQSSYRILYGEDVLADIKVERHFLRLQCERELKGIAIHLRTAYLEVANNPSMIRKLLEASIKKLIPIFKAILVLNDRKIPNVKSEIISSVEDVFGFGVSVFSDVFHTSKQIKSNFLDTFNRFTQTVDLLVIKIDSMNESQMI